MSKNAFDLKIAEIEGIPDSMVSNPDMPVAIALQEAEDLYEWCLSDKDALVKAGLDWKMVEDLPNRAGACRYLQSQWQKDYKSMEEAQKEWNRLAPGLFSLHDDMLHHLFHAYRNYPDLKTKVQKIAQGSGNADLIQDLSDIAALGKANPQQLQAINFDMALLDKAETLAEDMSALLAKANGLRMSDNKLRILRDKAYYFMKESVDEIRLNGQYIFWHNPDRKKGYVSLFNRKKNSSKTQVAEVKV
jgi:hypothetical protein